jgi:hypothetical protein
MDTEQLAKLIGQKRQLLERLWQLTERQAALVSESDLTRLLSLLAAKQTHLNQLQAIERQLDPFREQDPDERLWVSPEARADARCEAEACAQLLASVMRVEYECEQQLSHRRDDVAHRLQGFQGASQARTAYLQGSSGSSHQLDLSSES